MDRRLSNQTTNAGQRTRKLRGNVQAQKQLTPKEVAAKYSHTLADWHPKEVANFVATVSQSLRLAVQ